MSTCPKCGSGWSDAAAFCGACGAELATVVAGPAPLPAVGSGSILGSVGTGAGRVARAPGTPGTRSGSSLARPLLGAVVVLFGVFGIARLADDEPDAAGAGSDSASISARYGDCDRGDMDACDELYDITPVGSSAEDFGATCGGRVDPRPGDCWELEVGDGDLYSQCADGDMDACNDLYYESPRGSSDERFGSTCGYRRGETYGEC
jgi:hypothetical protein